MPSLSRVTSDAFAWRLLTETSRLALAIGVQVVLARMLPVEAFGMLAIALLMVSFGSKVAEIGTAPALIQRATVTDVHVRVAFSISVVMGFALSAAIWFAAPALGSLFHAPEVAPVLRVVGLVFVLGSVGTTADALLQRAMEYRRLLKAEVISYAVGFAGVGIATAMLGYGVWALAWATLAQTAIKAAILVSVRPHAMRPCFARAEMRQLLNFGAGISLSRLAAFGAENSDNFVVARWLGATALGLYARAYQVMCLPIHQFASLLNDVLFPAYSGIQADNARLRRGYLTSVSASAIVVFPVLTIVALAAPELMVGVFGRQWLPAAAPLRILCVAGAGYCIYTLADSLIRAKGAVYAKFLAHSAYAVCVLAAAVIGKRWGINGVAAGVVVATAVVYLLMARLSLRLIDGRWAGFFFAQWPGIVVSAAAAAAVVPILATLRAAVLPPLVILAASGSVAVLVIAAAAVWMPRAWMLPSVVALVDTAMRTSIATLAVVGFLRRRREAAAAQRGLPRPVDAAVASLLLVLTAPVLAAVAVAIALTSGPPVLFRHWRVGQNGQPFELLKFRTMEESKEGPEVTAKGDARVTRLGRFLRRTKLDELPELWNVVRGDMALVGPRPEALRYALPSNPLWQQVLSVRPGVTDAITIRLRNEEELLAAAGADHEQFYREFLLPYKLRAAVDDLAVRTWKRDVAVLALTALAVIAPSRIAPPSTSEIVAKGNP